LGGLVTFALGGLVAFAFTLGLAVEAEDVGALAWVGAVVGLLEVGLLEAVGLVVLGGALDRVGSDVDLSLLAAPLGLSVDC
jgi:hypothetical protein